MNVTRRLRLTSKVMRGLSEVHDLADADVSVDPERFAEDGTLDDITAALKYLEDLRYWYKSRHPKQRKETTR